MMVDEVVVYLCWGMEVHWGNWDRVGRVEGRLSLLLLR